MTTRPFRSLIVAWLCLLSFTVQAQDVRPVKSVQFKDGKTLAARDGGKPEVITNEVSMAGAIQVNTNGTFTVARGRERHLTEGQVLAEPGQRGIRRDVLTPGAYRINQYG